VWFLSRRDAKPNGGNDGGSRRVNGSQREDGSYGFILPFWCAGSVERLWGVGSVESWCERRAEALQRAESAESRRQGRARHMSAEPETGCAGQGTRRFEGPIVHSSGAHLLGWGRYADVVQAIVRGSRAGNGARQVRWRPGFSCGSMPPVPRWHPGLGYAKSSAPQNVIGLAVRLCGKADSGVSVLWSDFAVIRLSSPPVGAGLVSMQIG